MGNEGLYSAVGCFCCVIFIVSVILFGVSFDTLRPTEVGLKHNGNLCTVTENVYGNGRYFLGLGLSFVEFPMNVQYIEFHSSSSGELGSLRAWSNEGQLLELDVTIMYRLQRRNIFKLYMRYGENWHQHFVHIAVRAIKKVTNQYRTVNFFSQRTDIATHMRTELKKRFDREFTDVILFSMRNIRLPSLGATLGTETGGLSLFEQEIVGKVVQAQRVVTAGYEKLTAQKTANITVIKSTGDANVRKNLAYAYANQTKLLTEARATSYRRIREQEAFSFKKFQSAFSLESFELLQYKFRQLLSDLGTRGKKIDLVVGYTGETTLFR